MGKRIVFHVPSLRGGGAERVFVLMANEMAARGHSVTLFVWNAEGPNAELISPAVTLVNLGMPIHGEGFGKPATLRGLVRSATFLRHTRPDAVFSAPEFANLLTALALVPVGRRTAFFPSYHAAASLEGNALGSRIAPFLARVVAWRATKAIAVSRGIGLDLSARGFPDERIAVIHNPLPPPGKRNPSAYPWQKTLDAMGSGPVIITLGRLVPVKDHRTLLKAFSLLDPAQEARLVIFGEGPLKEDLVDYAGELDISGRVLFPGYVNDPAACYAIANLFVLSSTSEGFGNVLIEAMAAGVPVLSTDAPHGPREILADGRFGALVPVGDATALSEAMSASLAPPLPSAELRARAGDFGISLIGDQYEALINNAD
ncbi:glycosyltransferase [Rhizobium puerariae]|uniref:Glycosyltransferase n=1 Tax=Rhizobium puerariae TaxID=1585791 RepID=A0ABV6AI77_9HYPH